MAVKEKPGLIFWDPVTGCAHIDKDCEMCWAQRYSIRRQRHSDPSFAKGFMPTMHPENLNIPSNWKYRHLVIVASSSDLFLGCFDDDFILETFHIMNTVPECEFIVQTKNSKRMLELSRKIVWTDNIWMGVTVTSKKCLDRIEHLRNTGAKIKWVAFKPLRKDIPQIDLNGINWVTIGPSYGTTIFKNYSRRKTIIIDECGRIGIPYYENDAWQYRAYFDYKSNAFPKDITPFELAKKIRF